MYQTEQEIKNQYEALEKSLAYLDEQKKNIANFFGEKSFKRVIFMGCGSSFSLCQSAAVQLNMGGHFQALALTGGDVLLNPGRWEKIFDDSLLIVPSRSGQTSEVVKSCQSVQERHNSRVISVALDTGTPMGDLAGLALELPWAFDKSVCQTRSVSVLYTVLMYLCAVMDQNDSLLKELKQAVESGSGWLKSWEDSLVKMAQQNWDRAVVLADGELAGIAEEGALAFKEICQLPSNYYHLLDSRHGPFVLFNEKTLVFAVLNHDGNQFETDFIEDLVRTGSTVVTVGTAASGLAGTKLHLSVPDYAHGCVKGLPLILAIQLTCLNKALALGVNPDQPTGLDPWIKV